MQQSIVLGASVLTGLLLSTAAWADLTAEQVWQNWKDQTTSYGQTVTTTTETRAGDTLTVSGVSVTSEDEALKTKLTVDTITLRERGDGTVEVTMSPQIPITITASPEGETPTTVNALLDQPGFSVIATDQQTETRYDFSVPAATLTVDVPPGQGNPASTKATLVAMGLAGTYLVSTSDLSQIHSTVSADSAKLTLTAADPNPETGGTLNLTANATGLSGTSKGTMLPSDELEDMSAALAKGFAAEGTASYSGADYALDVKSPAQNDMVSSGTFGEGNMTFALDKDRMSYGGGAKAATMRFSGGQIPFPELVISYAETAFDLLMPVSKSDTPQDFKLLMRLVDLKISDEIWAMFDPTGALPRDPATLVIDTTGKARWLMDIFSPEAEKMESVPGELNALDINDLTLRAVGAEVTGKGAFTFDNSDMTTFDGVPLPTGKLDLKIVGANGLLDKLSQSGLLPQDQVMGARMMMGLFARPGEGPDTLTSTLEFKDKGFFANGQQLQ